MEGTTPPSVTELVLDGTTIVKGHSRTWRISSFPSPPATPDARSASIPHDELPQESMTGGGPSRSGATTPSVGGADGDGSRPSTREKDAGACDAQPRCGDEGKQPLPSPALDAFPAATLRALADVSPRSCAPTPPTTERRGLDA